MNRKNTIYKPASTASNIDEYLSAIPIDFKRELQKIRDTINSTIPDIEERIAYQICVFKIKKDLVGFAAYKDYCSFYTMSPRLVNKMKKDLAGYKVTGATIHFTPKTPLPSSLIKKILNKRLKEISDKN